MLQKTSNIELFYYLGCSSHSIANMHVFMHVRQPYSSTDNAAIEGNSSHVYNAMIQERMIQLGDNAMIFHLNHGKDVSCVHVKHEAFPWILLGMDDASKLLNLLLKADRSHDKSAMIVSMEFHSKRAHQCLIYEIPSCETRKALQSIAQYSMKVGKIERYETSKNIDYVKQLLE